MSASSHESGAAAPGTGASPAPVKIRIHGVGKAFRAGKEAVEVLENVHLEIREREFVAVVGPSGCGKTTLLNCVAGFETFDRGSIEIDGSPVRAPSNRRVFVFQEPGIFPWLDVDANVGFGLPRRMAARQRADIVQRCVDLVGLQGFEHALPHELSGGMKQRVEFARALAVDPDVLFLDEPFGALDAITRLEMRREIVRIWQATGKTCILVTHDVEEACELADRIAVMTRRPATIQEVVDNPLPRPREPDQPAFRRLKAHIFDALGVEPRV